MRLIGLRHGQSGYNVLGLCNDDPADPVALTATGTEQALAASDQLAGQAVDRLYCSPLLRTRQTAELVASRLGLGVIVDERLADIRSGFNGRPVAEYLAAIADDPVNTRPVGGESLYDYAARVGEFLDWVILQPFPQVLLVVHEETLRVIHARAGRLSLAQVAGMPFANCQPYFFQFDSENL